MPASKRLIAPEDLLQIRLAVDPQISPDGRRVLFGRRSVTPKNEYLEHLLTVEEDGALTEWTQGDKSAKQGRWSPDGRFISFISAREEGRPQFYLLSAAGGEARRISNLPEGTIEKYSWSPDGRRLAFTFRETAKDWTEAAKKDREQKGLSIPPRVVDHGWYRLDGDGYFDAQRFKLHVLSIDAGEHRTLYDACATGQYRFAWAPDSKELAVTHTLHPHTWPETADDTLVRVPLKGKPRRLSDLAQGRKMDLAWSPDGKTIAFIGHEFADDPWDAKNARLYSVSASGGPAVCLTAGDDYCLKVMSLSDMVDAYSFAFLAWAPDGRSLYVSVGRKGETHVGRVGLAGPRRVELLTRGKSAVTAGPIDRAGARMACLAGGPTRPPEVAVLELGGPALRRPRALTRLNEELFRELSLSEPEDFWVDSADGTRVHAWVLRPPRGAPDLRKRGRAPAVLEIHGGPHAQYGWAFFHEFQCLAAQGYAVVYANPRGSKGYGEKHTTDINGAWGGRDWEDIQAVLAWMKAHPELDSRRLGVMGGSYGGYMTNWAVGHTRDFKAAITDRCVSNMVSMVGSSDFPFFMKPYWNGNPWGGVDGIAELWRQSPLSRFDKVDAPMLIIHSEGDLRCNIEQAEQVFTALQVRGVESRFVRYPATTSHGLSRAGPPDLRVHRLGEILRWWRRHLG